MCLSSAIRREILLSFGEIHPANPGGPGGPGLPERPGSP